MNAKPNFAPYFGIFRIRLIAGMQYRAAAWAGIATQFFWGGIELLVYAAFYRSGIEPMPYPQLADLVWMRQAFLALVMLWAQDGELLETVSSGNVAYELCRPFSLYSFWFARLLAFRISRTIMRCVPIFVIAFFLPEPYRFHLPPDLTALLLFVPAIVLAALLVVTLSMYIYLLTFITLDSLGSRLIFGVTAEFLMGALIPIPFMPAALQRFLNFLPFRYMADFPFRVYSGSITAGDAVAGIGIQCFWIILLAAGGLWGFHSIQKRIVVQGG
ncbi:ABC transporter permease [Spirochaetia bacterium]|nr:ABC transporter permease [Spirochaetia bacterium]GHV49374.1 ABC transporter permease [Spirochaetia bacterium]